MAKAVPFIHTFKTRGGNYIYDVNRNTILRVPEKVYEILKEGKSDDAENEEKIVLERIRRDGFLSSERMERIIHPVDDTLAFHLQNKVSMVILQITQNCNLRCRYCIYSGGYENRGHSGKKMSLETAKKGVDFLISHSRDAKSLNVGFYGGEPLLEFDLIRKVVAYAEEMAEGKDISFNITTNGTVMDRQKIEFFIEHDVSLMISLDGPRELHDRNRKFAVSGCGTYDSIFKNLEFVEKDYPEYYKKIRFSVVMDPKNDYSCVNEFFLNHELVKELSVMPSIVSDRYNKNDMDVNESFEVQNKYETFKVYLSKLGKFDEKHISKINIQYFDKMKKDYYEDRKPMPGLGKTGHHGGPCIPGVQRLFVDADGGLFPCEKVSEASEVMKIGTLDGGFDVEKARKLLNIGQLTEKKCLNCWTFRFCSLCATSADAMTELSAEKKMTFCEVAKYSTEETMKDFCTLSELDCDFEDNLNIIPYL